MIVLFLVFWETSILLSTVAASIYISTSSVWGFPFLPILASIWCLCSFYESHFDQCEVMSHCGFDSHFPDDKRYWTSSHMPLGCLHVHVPCWIFFNHKFISSCRSSYWNRGMLVIVFPYEGTRIKNSMCISLCWLCIPVYWQRVCVAVLKEGGSLPSGGDWPGICLVDEYGHRYSPLFFLKSSFRSKQQRTDHIALEDELDSNPSSNDSFEPMSPEFHGKEAIR